MCSSVCSVFSPVLMRHSKGLFVTKQATCIPVTLLISEADQGAKIRTTNEVFGWRVPLFTVPFWQVKAFRVRGKF